VADLGLEPGAASTNTRVFELYLPLYFWIRRQVATPEKKSPPEKKTSPLIVGLHCPQGGGKTTMCEVLETLFAREGLTCVVASIDDFYLGHADLERVAAEGNPLLSGRGPPGTHDAQLMRDTIDALRFSRGDVAIPRYDKSAYEGRGDRRPQEDWPVVKKKADVVLLEGWCLGFQPQGDAIKDPHLRQIDDFLKQGLAPLYDLFDAFVTVAVRDPDVVYEWREQAEAQMRAKGRPAMTKEQVKTFVDRYMPLYRQYLPDLYASDIVPGNTLHVAIDKHREPIAPSGEGISPPDNNEL